MRGAKKTSLETVLHSQNVSPIIVGMISYKNIKEENEIQEGCEVLFFIYAWHENSTLPKENNNKNTMRENTIHTMIKKLYEICIPPLIS